MPVLPPTMITRCPSKDMPSPRFARNLLRDQGTGGITIDAIAAAAGVGRQTIYRCWPTKGAVVAEAMARGARAIVPARDTGSFSGDLISFPTDSFAGLQDPGTRRVLRQLASAAVHDEHVAEVLAEFTASAARPCGPCSNAASPAATSPPPRIWTCWPTWPTACCGTGC